VPGPAATPPSGRSRRVRAAGPLLAASFLLCGCSLIGHSAAAGAKSGAATASSTAASPSAAIAGSASAAPAAPPAGTRTLCRLTDPRLPELSGLVVAGDKMFAMNDGGDRLTVYVLDSACQVVDTRTAVVDPYDPEDLAVGADGTIWFSDTGDNLAQRATVALLAMHPDGTTGIYRLTYPDGPHDAESLLLAPDGTPYVVTKEVLGASGVYRPTGALVNGGTIAMGKVSTVTFALTGTPGGPVGRAGQLMATGGAVSGDGKYVALRTYTDAYVWALTGSDVAAALAGKPERIALPEAPQGEAVSFSADNRSLVVAGEGVPGDVTVVPLGDAPVPAGTSPAADTVAAGGHAGVPTVTAGVIAVVAATLLVWIGGKFRRRRA
jgi:hypothetical protein